MTFFDTTEGLKCKWNAQETYIACISVNQETYATLTKLHALKIENGKLIKKSADEKVHSLNLK